MESTRPRQGFGSVGSAGALRMRPFVDDEEVSVAADADMARRPAESGKVEFDKIPQESEQNPSTLQLQGGRKSTMSMR